MSNRSQTATGAPRRRSSSTDRWSASSTIEWLDHDGRPIARTADTATAPDGAAKAKVHYRYLGKGRKRTFKGTSLFGEVRQFQALLTAAYLHNWVADEHGSPRPPAATPATPTAPTAPTTPATPATPATPEASRDVPSAKVPRDAGSRVVHDVEELVRWSKRRHQTVLKRRGGERRKNTSRDYASSLDFFLDHARYRSSEGSPEEPDLTGRPWTLDDPLTRVTETDLLWMIELRSCTNLRTRVSNEAKMVRWGEQVSRATQGGAPDGALPEAPELALETASARTIEAFARTIREMFHDAFAHGLIDYQPWTIRVDEEVPRACAPSYSAKLVPSRDEVAAVSVAMRRVKLVARSKTGRRELCDGDRYGALVWTAGREALRPEESIAIRDGWVILDDDPRIVLHGAEIFEVQEAGPRRRIQVPLKHRQPGEIRVVRPAPPDRAEFVRVLAEHRAKYVKPRSSGTSQTGDPYFFTNHAGDPIELSNFGRWWRAALAEVPAADRITLTERFPFRRLRAAATTDWLTVLRFSTQEAADKAGNTQHVIERHYKSVLAARPVDAPTRSLVLHDNSELASYLRDLSSHQFQHILAAVNAETSSRMR